MFCSCQSIWMREMQWFLSETWLIRYEGKSEKEGLLSITIKCIQDKKSMSALAYMIWALKICSGFLKSIGIELAAYRLLAGRSWKQREQSLVMIASPGKLMIW